MSVVRSIDAVAAFRTLGFDIETVSSERVVLARSGRRVIVPRHKDLAPHDVDVLLATAQVAREAFAASLNRRPSSGVHSKVIIIPPKAGQRD